MVFKKVIAEEIKELFNAAPPGTSEYFLEHYNQQDVADTVNRFATTNPKAIQDTYVDYSGKAPIIITK